VPIGQLSHIDR